MMMMMVIAGLFACCSASRLTTGSVRHARLDERSMRWRGWGTTRDIVRVMTTYDNETQTRPINNERKNEQDERTNSSRTVARGSARRRHVWSPPSPPATPEPQTFAFVRSFDSRSDSRSVSIRLCRNRHAMFDWYSFRTEWWIPCMINKKHKQKKTQKRVSDSHCRRDEPHDAVGVLAVRERLLRQTERVERGSSIAL